MQCTGLRLVVVKAPPSLHLGAYAKAILCLLIFLFYAVRYCLNLFIGRLLGTIHGVKLTPEAPGISSLLYADDVLLFCGANAREVEAILQCVDKYCAWSGQSVSCEKSGIFISKGVHRQFIQQVKQQWGFKQVSQGAKYLGTPLFLSKNKSNDFAFVKEKLEAHISV